MNLRVSRHRKAALTRADNAFAQVEGLLSISSFFAKVRVAGSNPVARSDEPAGQAHVGRLMTTV
jgi:hypothetical protein